jgi:hypothetical protein
LWLRRADLDLLVGVRDYSDGGIGVAGLNIEKLGKIGGHDVPGVCGENFAGSFEAAGNEGRADLLAVDTEAKFRAGEKAKRDAKNSEPAVVIVETGLGEPHFMIAIGIDNVFEMYDVIFGLSVYRNVALLNAAAQSFDDVTFCIDKNRGMIPPREFIVWTPVTNLFTETDHVTGPTVTVSEDEIAGARVDDLLARQKRLDRSSVERRPETLCKHHASLV